MHPQKSGISKANGENTLRFDHFASICLHRNVGNNRAVLRYYDVYNDDVSRPTNLINIYSNMDGWNGCDDVSRHFSYGSSL